MKNLLKILEDHSVKLKNKTVLQIKIDNTYVKTNYSELYSLVRNISNELRSKGIKKGDKIALFTENSPEWVIAYLGIHGSGATVVPLDIQYTARELSVLLPFAGVKNIITSTENYEKIIKDISKELELEHIYYTDGETDNNIFKLENSDAPLAERDFQDEMSMIFTSGTTGDPKGVILTDENFISNVDGIHQQGFITSDDVILSILPLHHCYAFTTTVLLPLYCGGTIVFQPSLKGPDIISAIVETDVTAMAGVPQLYAMIEKNIFAKIEKLDPASKKIFKILFKLSEIVYDRTGIMIGRKLFGKIHSTFGNKFRFFVSGGAKLDKTVSRNLTILGFRVIEGYGLTETSPVLTMVKPDDIKIGSCGKALPNVTIKINNPGDEGTGEIIAQGPNIMKGYYKKEEETAKIIKDGWFYTGDLGYLDKDNYLFITGRAKEIIVLRSGKNIYPDEVEKHYQESDFVQEICVMGIEDDQGMIEQLKAIVVPNYRLLREMKIVNCTHHIKCDFEQLSLKIPTYMRIKDFVIVSEELPRTRLGKLKRNEIKKRGLFDSEGSDDVKKPELTDEEKKILAIPIISRLAERVKNLAVKTEIYPGDNLELDLGIDSLMRLELLVILESEFSLKLSEEEGAMILSFNDLIEKVQERGELKEVSDTGLLVALKNKPEIPLEDKYSLKPGIIEYIIKWGAKRFFKLLFKLFYKIKISGTEKIPARGNFMLCANHTSFLDPLIIFASLPDRHISRTFFIALEEMFGGFIMSGIVRLCRIITTGTETSMIRSLQYSNRVLKKGFPLCIFPEGQRTIDGNLEKPKKGFSLLSCENNSPVFPIYIDGAINTFSKPYPGHHKTEISIVIGDPIYPPVKQEYSEEDYELIMKKWFLTIRSMEHKFNLEKKKKDEF